MTVGKPRPDFIIAGAPRCATTFLVRNLEAHPQVCFARSDEDYSASDVHFFDRNTPKGAENFSKGMFWYEKLFAHCSEDTIKGEKTADYLVDPDAARLIGEYLGGVSVIVVLRDPVERAQSHFWHSRHRLPLSASLAELIDRNTDYGNVWILESGFYHRQLQRFIKTLGRDNIMVLIQEELREEPEEQLQRICYFLKIRNDVSFPMAGARVNPASGSMVAHWIARVGSSLRSVAPGFYRWLLNGQVAGLLKRLITKTRGKDNAPAKAVVRAYPNMSAEERRKLRALYRDDVKALSEMLGRDLEEYWWGQNGVS